MAASINNKVFDYCARRLDPQFLEQIRNDINNIGVETPDLEKDLQKGEYIPVLSAIWGERDQSRLVQWLRKHAGYHAPLMFERAIAEFEAVPTVQTVVRVSLPWIHAAAVRTYQDQRCLLNHSSESRMLSDTYLELLKDKMRESMLDLEAVKERYKAVIHRNTFNWLSQFVNNVDMSTLPSPDWIRENSDGSSCPMIRLTDYNWVREMIAQEALKHADFEVFGFF